MTAPTPPPVSDGTIPHPDPRRERFAHLVARGSFRGDAYQKALTSRPITSDSAKSGGWRILQEPAVAARVKAIRAALARDRSVDDRPLDRDDMLGLMGGVTTAYERAISALAVTGNPTVVAKLRSDLVVHLGRLNRLTPSRTAAPSASTNANLFEDALNRLHVCRCRQ